MTPACTYCKNEACVKGQGGALPSSCPANDTELLARALSLYQEAENHTFYVRSSEIETLGYGQWTRIQEILHFCRNMSFRKIGLPFCKGLQKEAAVVQKIFESSGFEVVSVCCKAGGMDKETAGIAREMKRVPQFEAMCNPIFQAMVLNAADTELNVLIGLCVGHDSLFYKYSKALVTTLVVKDRVLAHNPVGAIYQCDSYYRTKLSL